MSRPSGLSLDAPLHSLRLLLTDARYFWIVAGLVVAGDAFLTALIVRFVACTYPAGHVLVHRAMHTLTEGGLYLKRAQALYGALYVLSLALTCAIYRQTRSIPNWVLLLLPLSKRLHSIFALRMFNDCWAVVVAQASVLAFGVGFDHLACVLYSLALSVKMSVILYLPAVLLILFKRRGLMRGATLVATIVQLQVLLGLPFLRTHPREYLAGAFDLSRVFLYKWTVNWRFVPEDVFLSRPFATTLLLGHVGALVAFGLFRWCRRDGGAFVLLERGLRRPSEPPSMQPTLSADHVITLLATSNLIGMLFARSLHYQFYSWYAHQLPLLAWRTKLPVPMRLGLLAAIEYAWNVYPSTNMSSGVLLVAHIALLLGIWFGWAEGRVERATGSKDTAVDNKIRK